MAIKSSISQKDALGNSIDSGKNPKTLEQKSGFQRYIHAVADQVGNGDPIASEKEVIDYTKKYHPGSVADVIEYYASFNAKPTTSANTQNKAQTYVPEAWKPKTDTKVETVVPETGNTDSGNTSTDT